jgi:predicted transcriptional regulator
MARVKDECYFQVSGWMINRLGLKGTTLNVYAIIYGFTQDGESEFTGSRQYLCDFTGATKPTIDKALNDLINMGLIIKVSNTINNITFNKFKVDLSKLNNFTGGKETLLGGSKETLPNNINNNIDIKESKKESNYDTIINSQITNEDLKITLYEFVKMRKLIKKPMTDRALQLLIGKLHKLANTPDKAIQVLEQSIVNNWQDIYELKSNYIKPKDNGKQATKREYTKEQLNDLFDNIEDVEI